MQYSPHIFQQLLAPLHATHSFRKRQEKLVFRRGEENLLSAGKYLVPGCIYGNAACLDQFAAGFARLCPSEDGLDAKQQFPDRKRLHHVIIGAHFKPHNTIYLFSPGGNHDDRYAGGGFMLLQLLADLRSRQARNHQVEEYQIGEYLLRGSKAGGTIQGYGRPMPLLSQVKRKEFGQDLFIFDNKYGFHGYPSTGETVSIDCW